jgi:hypothetical protein
MDISSKGFVLLECHIEREKYRKRFLSGNMDQVTSATVVCWRIQAAEVSTWPIGVFLTKEYVVPYN